MNEQNISKNIRKLRTQAGFALTSIAKKANLTKSTLSKIETGQTSPPISTLIRIARAINVPIADFFAEEDKEPEYVLTRKGQGQIVIQNGSQFGYSYEALALEIQHKYVEPFLLTINPDDPPGQFHHRGQEFIYMLSGAIDFTFDGEVFRLKSGDSFFFDSSCPHGTKIVGKKSAKFLCIFIQENQKMKKREDKK
jgi:transcriptional regulator with XRE-family HTH domain